MSSNVNDSILWANLHLISLLAVLESSNPDMGKAEQLCRLAYDHLADIDEAVGLLKDRIRELEEKGATSD